MYEMLAKLLVEEFGLDADVVRPEATARELDMDSLMIVELAVIVTEQTGVRLEDVELSLDSTLGEVAERFAEAHERMSTAAPASDTTSV